MTRIILFTFFSLSIIAVDGCNSGDVTNPSTPGPWYSDSSTFNVSFTPSTVYFDSVASSALISSDTAAHTYTFNPASSLSSQLDTGKFILVWRKGMGKIINVDRSGTNVVVTTDTCTLDQIIKDGTISFDYGIDFDPDKVIFPTVAFTKHSNQIMTPMSGDSFGIRLDYGSDYIYKIAFKLKGESAYVKIGVEKKLLQGFRASFTAEGNIGRFRQKSSMRFQSSQLQSFEHINSHMNGDLKLSIAAAGSANDALNFEIPIVVAKYPVPVGPFIFFINVKIQVVANCYVPPEASSLIDVRFKYDSDLGFTYDGANANVFGREGNESMEKDGEMKTAAASACAASFGIGFPRTELELFAGLVVPYVQPAYLIGGDFVTGIHPCMTGKASFIASAGVNMGFAGLTLKKSFPLWQTEKVILKSGDCQ